MQLALDYDQLEKAEQLAVLFGLNMQQLLEAAADQKLDDGQFSHAITLYKLSRVSFEYHLGCAFIHKMFLQCRFLKSALKFARSGHPQELLRYIEILLSARDTELSQAEKMHLSNLAMMSFAEQILRQSALEGSSLYIKYLLVEYTTNLSLNSIK
jgi:hypothetical protein